MIALVAQSITGDAQSAAGGLRAFVESVTEPLVITVFLIGMLAALAGQALGFNPLPGSPTVGKVIVLSLVVAYALGAGPGYLAGLM